MALSTATITANLSDMLGVDFDTRRTKVWVETNVPDDTVIDTVGNAIRLGTGTATLNSDGTLSLAVWKPGTGSNPDSWQTTIHVDYPDPGTRSRKSRAFGPFTITADADLADLVEEQEVPAEYLTTVTALLDNSVEEASNSAFNASVFAEQAEAARDDAVDISGISTPDAVVEALVKNTGGGGPLTSAALASAFIPAVMAVKYGVVAESTADQTSAVEAAFAAAVDVATSMDIGPFATVDVVFPNADIYCNAEVPAQVRVVSNGTRFRAFGSGYTLTMTGNYSSLERPVVFGGGAGHGGAGIHIAPGVVQAEVHDATIDQCDDRGIFDQGLASVIARPFAQNCLLAASGLSQYTGVLELAGTDADVTAPEVTSSRTTVSSSGKAGAIVISGANNRLELPVGEVSDFGIATLPGATDTLIIAPRAEFNAGHGIILAGGDGVIVTPKCLNNGAGANNTYSHIICTAPSGFDVIAPVTESRVGNVTLYGIRDQNLDATTYNKYLWPRDFRSTTAVSIASAGVTPILRVPAVGTPTGVAGFAAGSAVLGTITIAAAGGSARATDERGVINIATGTGTYGANGAEVAKITLASSVPIGAVILTAQGYPGEATDQKFYVRNIADGYFEIWSKTQLASSTTYSLLYHVVR